MADRKGIRMAEANWPAAPGQVARLGESGLAARLQLRGAQPDPAAATDGSTNGNAPGAVCLSNCCEPRGRFLKLANPYKHRPQPYFKQISNGMKRKSQAKTPQLGEFQRVPRRRASACRLTRVEQQVIYCSAEFPRVDEHLESRIVCNRKLHIPRIRMYTDHFHSVGDHLIEGVQTEIVSIASV